MNTFTLGIFFYFMAFYAIARIIELGCIELYKKIIGKDE